MGVSVQELITFPFVRRTIEEQTRIVKEGPSRPKIIAISTSVGSKKFEQLDISKKQWITICTDRKSLFCWPCLLYNPAECVWSRQGISDMMYSPDNMHTHEKSYEHIQAVLALQLFYNQNIKSLNLALERGIKERAGTAASHRKTVKLLIDAVCTCAAKEKTPRHGDRCSPQINLEDCVRILNLIGSYDTRIIKETGDAIELINQSPKIICDITDAITNVMRLAIRKEAQMSTYVSIILSGHSERADRSPISTVLRYINKGKVCERFVGFVNIGNNTRAGGAYKHILSAMNDFDLSDRFLAYSLDGGVLPQNKLTVLLELMKKDYPYSFFVPWYGHLDYFMHQSLMHFKECRCFFKTINAIKHNFCKNSRRYRSLNNFMCEKRPELKNNPKWFNGSSVSTYRKDFIEYFDLVVANSKKWNADDIACAFGFCQFLQEPQTVFLLQVFAKIFELMSSFQTVLKGNNPDNIFATYHHDILKRDLRTLRDSGFDQVMCKTAGDWDRCRSVSNPAKLGQFRVLFGNIINHIIEEIGLRYDHLYKLEFCHMLNYDKYVTNCTYRIVYISKLVEAHGEFFDRNVIYNELDVLQKNAASFPSESIEVLQDFFLASGAWRALPNLFKLVELRLTLPIKRPEDATKHKDIVKWSYTLQDDMVAPGNKSVLCVESSLLKDLKKSETFHDDVISALDQITDAVKLL